ncbi:Peroxisomal NADH pyrophosphatase nudt12 [Mortierella sp. AD031]|nr:Peroxisomal NADH pyrophosphatase nudt12 [Mortierella sp. AD031]KAG0211570.1 Peroxisomal NADH pyrophosphatase nudt12 [Mortierella sp. NVP41]
MSPSSTADVFEAAASGQLDAIKTLGRIHLEAKNDRGWTPLMFAARYGHASVVEFLLAQAKVDPLVVNKDGKTAAELADFWGSIEAVAVFDRLAPNKNRVQHSVGSPFAPPSPSPAPSNPMAAGAGLVAGTQKPLSSSPSSIAEWWNKWSVKESKPIQFTGATHNRSSFLRTDKEYLQESLQASSTRFVIFADHGVLFKSSSLTLAYASYDDIKQFLGPDPINKLPDGLVLVFLGVDETGNAQPQQEGEVLVRGRRGVGYWALDLSARNSTQELKDSIETWTNTYTEKHGHYMAEMRPAAFGLTYPESGLVAQARSVVDWNKRNQFCAGCGQKSLSLEGGHKRSCPPTINRAGEEVQSDCLAHKGVQNFTYPRTDPVVIVCVISPDNERVLLGRQSIWPKGMYSCLAGFVEPGESLEEAARREVKEESGIRLGHVRYHSSQPWPFPNSLMMGCHAEALNENADITLEDKELEDAKWFTRQQILEALKSARGSNWGKPSEDGSLRLSPPTAIAHHILKAWATEEGEIPLSKM